MTLEKIETPNRRRHGFAAVREQIILAAREIMRTEGVGALSLNEVARRVGMKTPSLYTYFESKHALYDEIFRLGMRQYRQELETVIREHAEGSEAISAVISHYLRFADESPELYSLVFERPVPGFEPSPGAMAEAEALLTQTDAYVQRLLDSGVLRSGLSVQQTRDVFVVLMHGLASLKRANEPDVPLTEGRFGPLMPHVISLIESAWISGDSPHHQGGAS